MIKVFVSLLLLCLSLPATAQGQGSPWYQQLDDGRWELQLYFFWSLQCPHCKEAIPVVEQMAADMPWLRVHSLEISQHPKNLQPFAELAALFGEQPRSVPAFYYCGERQLGFDHADGIGRLIREQLQQCYRQLLEDQTHRGLDEALIRQDAANLLEDKPEIVTEALPDGAKAALILPVLGELDRGQQSLLLITVVLAGLDAFNPCAFFVLLFLLSMLVHMRNRRRMLFIGGVFVFVSGALYFLFIAAWLNLFLLLGMQRIFTLGAGLVALLLAAVNIKDFLRPGKGFSLSIPESKKPGLFARMRGLLQADNLLTMTLATITLAIAANTYELLCTAGLPMVYTRILTLEALPLSSYYLYLLLYSVIYVVPLLLIVGVFTWTMGQRKIQAHEGQLLKLLAGMMMLAMGVILLFAPQWMSSITAVVSAMSFALVVTLLAWWRQR